MVLRILFIQEKMPGTKSVEVKQGITFKTKFDYILNLVGLMVGFSNVWRFPYMCYKNGGGSFLVAYILFIVILIFPLIIIESALGQYTGHSAIKVWTAIPLFRGIGYASPILMFFFNVYYPILLVWAARWLVSTFSAETPWVNCDNAWNTDYCLPLFAESGRSENTSMIPTNSSQLTSSVEEYWSRYILNMTSGIEYIGGIKPDLLVCHIVIWTLVYFSIWKGVQWTSRIVYITATLPIVMLLVVLVRGATLDGAKAGITEYLRPNITKLIEFEVWSDAASQVLFSLGVCAGGITTLSKFNKYNHNFYRDSVILVVANGCVSFLAGFATFSILGFLAHAKNTTVNEVAESGPGLVFIVYPTALSLLPLPQLWCALFFIMLLFLGFDSLFVYQETFVSCMKDQFPKYFQFKWANEIWTAIASFVMFLFGLPIITRGGMYVLHLFNTYSVTGWCLYFISLVEFIAIGWFYDADKLLDDIKSMIGFDISRFWFKACWKFIGPFVSAGLMIYSLAIYEPLKYGRSYVYPVWADILGWVTALSSTLVIPVTAIYVAYTSEGQCLGEKIRNSIRRTSKGKRVEQSDKLETELKMLKEDADERSSNILP